MGKSVGSWVKFVMDKFYTKQKPHISEGINEKPPEGGL
jgi:hypothetical protein